MIFLARRQARQFVRFSATVLPVTVMQSPSQQALVQQVLHQPRVPPTECRSSMTYLPLGLKIGE